MECKKDADCQRGGLDPEWQKNDYCHDGVCKRKYFPYKRFSLKKVIDQLSIKFIQMNHVKLYLNFAKLIVPMEMSN